MRVSTRRRLAALGVGLALMSHAGLARAHVSVTPAEGPTGVSQRYGLLVPSEKPIPTTRVEVQFPAGLRVAEVESVPGWRATTQADRAGRTVGAVWDAGLIPNGRFVEFGVLARAPETPTDLAWNVIQTYQDGTEVHWIGPPGAEFPAAMTRVRRKAGAIDASMVVAALAAVIALIAAIGATLAWRRATKG